VFKKGGKMKNIIILTAISLLPLFAQEDFLKGVRAEDLMVDRIEKVPIEVVKALSNEWGVIPLEYWSEIGFSPAYSPDSSFIAEVQFDKPGGTAIGLRIFDRKTNIEKNFEMDCEDLKWSPSGKYLSFIQLEYIGPSGIAEKRTSPPYFNHERLCVYNTQTGEIKSIYDLGRFSLEHYWSPKYDYLAYSGFYHNSFKFAVYDAKKDTEYIIDTAFAWRGELWNFSWSPNGVMLVYTKPLKMDFYVNEEVPVKSEVFLVNYDGTGRIQLTDTPVSEIFVKWLPDGKIITEVVSHPDVPCYEEEHFYIILKRRKQ
jgi:Tol biopolymer transport system component